MLFRILLWTQCNIHIISLYINIIYYTYYISCAVKYVHNIYNYIYIYYVHMTSYVWPLKSSHADLMKLRNQKKLWKAPWYLRCVEPYQCPKWHPPQLINDWWRHRPSCQWDSTSNVELSYHLSKTRCQAGEHTSYIIRWNMKLVSFFLVSIHRDIHTARKNKVQTVQTELRRKKREDLTEAVFSYMPRRFHFLGDCDYGTTNHSDLPSFSTVVLHCSYPLESSRWFWIPRYNSSTCQFVVCLFQHLTAAPGDHHFHQPSVRWIQQNVGISQGDVFNFGRFPRTTINCSEKLIETLYAYADLYKIHDDIDCPIQESNYSVWMALIER